VQLRPSASQRVARRAPRCSPRLGPSTADRCGPTHLQVVLNCGYEEDYLISNVKLALGFLA
jgi:hypothetical protein